MNLYADSAAKFGELLSKPDKISSSDETPDKFGYKIDDNIFCYVIWISRSQIFTWAFVSMTKNFMKLNLKWDFFIKRYISYAYFNYRIWKIADILKKNIANIKLAITLEWPVLYTWNQCNNLSGIRSIYLCLIDSLPHNR